MNALKNFLKTNSSRTNGLILISTIVMAAAFFLTGCHNQFSKPIVIWTDRAELASYTEVFNTSQTRAKAVIVYKTNIASSLPPSKNEQAPDIVIGSWLKNSKIKKNFMTLDYMFSEQQLNPSIFYHELLSYGTAGDCQYLLPVSFNLPVVIFSKNNESLVTQNRTISTDEIQKTASTFNSKNKDGVFTTMGFAPSWNSDFLYLVTKIRETSFKEKGATFTWNEQTLANTISYIQNWTKTCNGSTTEEQDFSFKYLYTPDYKQVTSGRCLFAYTSSGKLFDTSPEQIADINYKWIANDGKTPVEDDIVTMGLCKNSKNTTAAELFIKWFFKEETQKKLIARAADMHLGSASFGIAGGFSSVRSVDEHVFPIYYQMLLGNLPGSDSLTVPLILPPKWANIKERIVIPYLTDAVKTDSTAKLKSMADRIADWMKQYN